MRRCLTGLLAGVVGLLSPAVHSATFSMPAYPMPKLVSDQFGQTKRIGFLSLVRQLYSGGVAAHNIDDLNFLDSDYAVIDSSSLPTLAAWLEATCHAVNFDLQEARQRPYDGTTIARLLETGATLAAVRWDNSGLAMPIGLLICTRRKAWGSLPGDGARDAYALISTEQGLQVYDPPTRQIVSLVDFPNTEDILNIEF
jgi:hypothetical protein